MKTLKVYCHTQYTVCKTICKTKIEKIFVTDEGIVSSMYHLNSHYINSEQSEYLMI